MLNVKEAGIEKQVIGLVKQFCISSYFLLDVGRPFVYRARQDGIRDLAIRYSEDELIALAQYFSGTFE